MPTCNPGTGRGEGKTEGFLGLFFNIFYISLFVRVCVDVFACTCHSTSIQVTEQLPGVDSLFWYQHRSPSGVDQNIVVIWKTVWFAVPKREQLLRRGDCPTELPRGCAGAPGHRELRGVGLASHHPHFRGPISASARFIRKTQPKVSTFSPNKYIAKFRPGIP